MRGELKDLWAYKEGEEDEKVRDETIEPGSEVAQKAREAKTAAVNGARQIADDLSEKVTELGEEVDNALEDESWMESTGMDTAGEGKARKRKTKKK